MVFIECERRKVFGISMTFSYIIHNSWKLTWAHLSHAYWKVLLIPTVDSISRHLLYYGTPSNNHKVYVTRWKPQSIDQLNLIMCTREFIYFKYRTNCLIVVHCIDSVYVHFWNVSVQFIVLYDMVFDTSSFSYTRLIYIDSYSVNYSENIIHMPLCGKNNNVFYQ